MENSKLRLVHPFQCWCLLGRGIHKHYRLIDLFKAIKEKNRYNNQRTKCFCPKCDENGYVITGELSTTKLKHFIQSELSQQRKEIVEWSKQLIGKHNARILNEFQKQGTTEMPFIAYDERVCLIPAITIAMEETDDDIITKLSEEK